MLTHAAIAFATALPTLLVAHHLGDHWVQTSCQAQGKSERSWRGARCCAAHVAGYTATTSALLGLVILLFGLPVSPLGFATGQLVSAGTHYWADRRYTLRWLATVVRKLGYYEHGGAYELDQSFHRVWLLVAALATALI